MTSNKPLTINLNSSNLDEIEFKVLTIILCKFSALVILNLEIQSLRNLDAPLSALFYVSGFAFFELLKFGC